MELATRFAKEIGQFLCLREAIAISLTCREASKLTQKSLRKVVLRSGHLTKGLRLKLWLHKIGAPMNLAKYEEILHLSDALSSEVK